MTLLSSVRFYEWRHHLIIRADVQIASHGAVLSTVGSYYHATVLSHQLELQLYKQSLAAQLPLPFLFSLSQCKGITRISEDSSEIVFLLVENYQLTARVGLRIGTEFLNKKL